MGLNDFDSDFSDIERELDDDESFEIKKKPKSSTKSKSMTKSKSKSKKTKTKAKGKQTKITNFTKNKQPPVSIKKLAYMFMDTYSYLDQDKAINIITKEEPLSSLKDNIIEQGPVLGVQISKDGKILATMCSLGHVKLWEIGNFTHLATLRDRNEEEIDEFYTGQFSPCQRYFIVGGKRKDRKVWSKDDDDNKIIDCYIKVFDLLDGKVINLLKAHSEEVLSIKQVFYKGENYYVSTSQDGSIYKWKLSEDHSEILESSKFKDNETGMAFNVSFVPNTGNRFFLGSCDNTIRLFDFETLETVDIFSTPYSSYCDNIKFLNLFPDVLNELHNQTTGFDKEAPFLISRGVELLDEDGDILDGNQNFLTLHRLKIPSEVGGAFQLEKIKTYSDHRYTSNSWYMNITSNGRYIFAPTTKGEIFIFCILSGEVIAILNDHSDSEIRDVMFHPNQKYLFSCNEDGKVMIYTQEDEKELIDI